MEPKEKKAFEPSGLVPRSIVRTFERFRQQLLPGSETAAIREYRISRYQVLVSARCLFTLLTIPIATNWLVSSWILSPLIEHFWNTQQNEIFLNSYQEERAFAELEFFSEKIFFESLLNKTGTFAIHSQPSIWESTCISVCTPKGAPPLTSVLFPTDSLKRGEAEKMAIVAHQRYVNDDGYFSNNPTSMLPCSFAAIVHIANSNDISKLPLLPSNYWLCKPVDETQRKKQTLRCIDISDFFLRNRSVNGSLLSTCHVPLVHPSSISYPHVLHGVVAASPVPTKMDFSNRRVCKGLIAYPSVTEGYANNLQNSGEYSREVLGRFAIMHSSSMPEPLLSKLTEMNDSLSPITTFSASFPTEVCLGGNVKDQQEQADKILMVRSTSNEGTPSSLALPSARIPISLSVSGSSSPNIPSIAFFDNVDPQLRKPERGMGLQTAHLVRSPAKLFLPRTKYRAYEVEYEAKSDRNSHGVLGMQRGIGTLEDPSIRYEAKHFQNLVSTFQPTLLTQCEAKRLLHTPYAYEVQLPQTCASSLRTQGIGNNSTGLAFATFGLQLYPLESARTNSTNAEVVQNSAYEALMLNEAERKKVTIPVSLAYHGYVPTLSNSVGRSTARVCTARPF